MPATMPMPSAAEDPVFPTVQTVAAAPTRRKTTPPANIAIRVARMAPPLVEVCAEAIRGRPGDARLASPTRHARRLARSGSAAGAVERLAHRRGRRLGIAGEELELATAWASSRSSPDTIRQPARSARGGQRRRPRVVDRVEEHRAGRQATAARQRVGDALGHGRDRPRRPSPATAASAQPAADQRDAERVGDRRELVDRLRAAGVRRSPTPAPSRVAAASAARAVPPAPSTATARPGGRRRRRAARPPCRARRCSRRASQPSGTAYQRVGRADRGRDRRRPRRPPSSATSLSGMVSDSPAHSGPSPATKPGQLRLAALDARVGQSVRPGAAYPRCGSPARASARSACRARRPGASSIISLARRVDQMIPASSARRLLASCSASVSANAECALLVDRHEEEPLAGRRVHRALQRRLARVADRRRRSGPCRRAVLYGFFGSSQLGLRHVLGRLGRLAGDLEPVVERDVELQAGAVGKLAR